MLIRRIRREQPDLQRAPHELRAVGGARLLEETRHVPSRVRVRVRVGVGVGAGVRVWFRVWVRGRVRVRVRVRVGVRVRVRVRARVRVQPRHVLLDHARRDADLGGDLAVEHALGHELEHRTLAVGQLGWQGPCCQGLDSGGGGTRRVTRRVARWSVMAAVDGRRQRSAALELALGRLVRATARATARARATATATATATARSGVGVRLRLRRVLSSC
jgi:hypothetical protein